MVVVKNIKIDCALLLFLLSLFTAFEAAAVSREILEQAKKEGEAVLYSTMPAVEFQIFGQAARDKYPFLNVRHVRLSSSNQVSRVMLEHKAGRLTSWGTISRRR